MTDLEYEALMKLGALAGVLAFVVPALRSIDASLKTLTGYAAQITDGLRDAGVALPEAPSVRGATAALVRHLKAAAILLLVGLALAGCSATADVRAGLRDLQRDFDTYRRASIAAVPSDADAHALLGLAIDDHIAQAIRRTE